MRGPLRETIEAGVVLKLGDNVTTDDIIPGGSAILKYISNIPEFAKYTFCYTDPDFVRRARELGHSVIVGGENYGQGSSREHAAMLPMYLGTEAVLAKSYARIHKENLINYGILPLLFEDAADYEKLEQDDALVIERTREGVRGGRFLVRVPAEGLAIPARLEASDGVQEVCREGDTVTVEPGVAVSVNGHRFPVAPCPENLLRIVEHGGLIEDTKRRLAESFAPSLHRPLPLSERKRGAHTMAERLLMANAGVADCRPGDILTTRPDFFMIRDVYTPYVLDTLHRMGATALADPDRVAVMYDHCMPTAVAKNDSVHYRAGLALGEEYGIHKHHIGEGICHTIMHEARYARPGQIATATDSHTTTYGGAGCFCTGIGTAEMCAALITGELWFKVPEAIKVVLNGHLPDGVLSKDAILKLLGEIRADGGQYKSLEFVGPAVRDMSMAARFTIANMALEAGTKCGLFECDETTAAYYEMPLEEIDWVKAGPDDRYEKVLTYDLSALEPQIACPRGVDDVHPISEVLGTPVDEVYLGSCTNGDLEDLAIAARYLKGSMWRRSCASSSRPPPTGSTRRPSGWAISAPLSRPAR